MLTKGESRDMSRIYIAIQGFCLIFVPLTFTIPIQIRYIASRPMCPRVFIGFLMAYIPCSLIAWLQSLVYSPEALNSCIHNWYKGAGRKQGGSRSVKRSLPCSLIAWLQSLVYSPEALTCHTLYTMCIQTLCIQTLYTIHYIPCVYHVWNIPWTI